MLQKKFFKTKDEADVTFEYSSEGAESAALVCELNGWQPIPMKFNKKKGVFRTKIRMPKNGEFQFRYLIDGENWANDTSADAYLPNEFGDQNSVVSTIA